MNKTLETNTRTYLLELVQQCTEAQQLLFKRMYSHKNLEASLEEVVNNMPIAKLDWAVSQCEKTLNI